MRKLRHLQPPLLPGYSDHKQAKLYKQISRILHENPTISQIVLKDLQKGIDPLFINSGRAGMTAEQVVRAAIVMKTEEFTYEELAFHLSDSVTFRTFMGYGIVCDTPSASTLQYNISRISPESWQEILTRVVRYAQDKGIEKGTVIRGDTTVVKADILRPSDSRLLVDCVRVLGRFLKTAHKLWDKSFTFTAHLRRAKRRFMTILNTKQDDLKKTAYRDLVKVTKKMLKQADTLRKTLMQFVEDHSENMWTEQLVKYLEKLTHYCDLTEKVISQTVRRVMQGEKVPSSEKVVSIFEEHADIIVKDNRETLYGHKINLFSGKSGLVLVCEILEGNPAESTLIMKMMTDFQKIYGYYPEKAAFDGGFTSKENVKELKKRGVKDIAFSKRKGMSIEEMCSSEGIYKKLRNFRAGIEAVISRLKRCFGLDVCDWKGIENFKKYVLSSVFCYNLTQIALRKI
jgi:transposase, IS5 family